MVAPFPQNGNMQPNQVNNQPPAQNVANKRATQEDKSSNEAKDRLNLLSKALTNFNKGFFKINRFNTR